jgi:hypothetical protein
MIVRNRPACQQQQRPFFARVHHFERYVSTPLAAVRNKRVCTRPSPAIRCAPGLLVRLDPENLVLDPLPMLHRLNPDSTSRTRDRARCNRSANFCNGFGSPFAPSLQIFPVLRCPHDRTAGRTGGTACGQACTGPTPRFRQFFRPRRTMLYKSAMSLSLSPRGGCGNGHHQ